MADLFVIHRSVEMILQQNAEREAAEKAMAETGALLISSATEMTVQETQAEVSTTQAKISNHSYGSPKLRPPRDSPTPLSNIGKPPKADLSGFYLILHCI